MYFVSYNISTNYKLTFKYSKQAAITPVQCMSFLDKPVLSPYEQASKNRISIAELVQMDTSTIQVNFLALFSLIFCRLIFFFPFSLQKI